MTPNRSDLRAVASWLREAKSNPHAHAASPDQRQRLRLSMDRLRRLARRSAPR